MKRTLVKEFFTAIRLNQIETVRAQIQEGGKALLECRQLGQTPLSFCLARKRTQIAKLIMEAGADPNRRDSDGTVPLHEAAWHGQLEVVRMLVSGGADVSIEDDCGQTALHNAIQGGHPKIVHFLITSGAFIRRKKSFLKLAAESGQLEIMKILEEAGARLNDIEEYRQFATEEAARLRQRKERKRANDKYAAGLIGAAGNGNTEEVDRLLGIGAGPNARSEEGSTPLMIAASWGHVEVVRRLLAANADVNLADETGRTAVLEAADRDHGEIVRLLLKAGSDPNLGSEHHTPLACAINNGNEEIAAMLASAGADSSGKTLAELFAEGDAENIAALEVLNEIIESSGGRKLEQLEDFPSINQLTKLGHSPTWLNEPEASRRCDALRNCGFVACAAYSYRRISGEHEFQLFLQPEAKLYALLLAPVAGTPDVELVALCEQGRIATVRSRRAGGSFEFSPTKQSIARQWTDVSDLIKEVFKVVKQMKASLAKTVSEEMFVEAFDRIRS